MRTLSQLLRAVLIGALILTAGFAAEDAKKTYDIPAGDAAAALKQFSALSGRETLFAAEAVRGVKTPAVRGELTVQEAIDALLADTGLVATTDAKTGAIAVRRETPAELKNAASRPTEVAAAEQGRTKDGVVELDAFEVFGSKSINADLPRSRDDVQPYVVFSRDRIEQSHALNLGDFLKERLPMNNFGADAFGAGSSANTNSAITLRGLSSSQTLILVDGRRIPPRASGGGGLVGQGDINGIPLSMIERVEILPSTASGIYGGGATGGVVNIITRKDFSGVEATVSYTNTFDTDSSNRRVNLNGSFNLEDGKTFLTFSSSYSDGTSLLTQDRDFAVRARALQFANNPAAYGPLVAFSPPSGFTSNIASTTGANLVLKNGTPLNAPFTFVPVGYAGPAGDGGMALVANAGRYNLDLPNSLSSGAGGRLLGLRAVPQVQSWALGARRKFGAHVEAYVDVSSFKNQGRLPTVFLSPTAVTIQPTAPTNPFTTAIRVTYPVLAPAFVAQSNSSTDRAAAGVVVKLPQDWIASADYVVGKSRTNQQTMSSYVGDPDGAGPLPSYGTALSTGLLNPLRDLNAFPLDYTPYLMPQSVTNNTYEARSQEATLRAAGPVWQLPAGAATLALSTAWRLEEQPESISINPELVPTRLNWFPPVSTEQNWVYLETRVPLFSEKESSLLRALEFQGAVRYDDYLSKNRPDGTAYGASAPADPRPATYTPRIRTLHATSGTVGIKYEPVPDVALRVSWGTGFLPPSYTQLAPGNPFNSSGTAVIDPKRSRVLASTGPIVIRFGGNPDLKPELSESLSGGVIFKPRFIPGLRLSVDYTRIEKQDEITSLSPQLLLDYEDAFPGLVQRDPLTPADQALGYTGGRITALTPSSVNFATTRITAYDFQVDYEMNLGGWGRFNPYATVTYQPKLASRVTPVAPIINNVGFNGPLVWRGNLGLDWKRGPWSASWNMQYYDSYLGYSATASPVDITNYILNQGAAKIPSQSYHDVSASYDFGTTTDGWRRYFSNTRITLGVQNVFNTSPPILAGTAAVGGFSGYGDPRLARYNLTLRKLF